MWPRLTLCLYTSLPLSIPLSPSLYTSLPLSLSLPLYLSPCISLSLYLSTSLYTSLSLSLYLSTSLSLSPSLSPSQDEKRSRLEMRKIRNGCSLCPPTTPPISKLTSKSCHHNSSNFKIRPHNSSNFKIDLEKLSPQLLQFQN